jgi:hypothetical protein
MVELESGATTELLLSDVSPIDVQPKPKNKKGR